MRDLQHKQNSQKNIIFFKWLFFNICLLFAANTFAQPTDDAPFIVVLGIAQDAGFPQADCQKACCAEAWKNPAIRQKTACLGIVDPVSGERWMIDATPNFKEQLWELNTHVSNRDTQPLNGVLLTHAHVGHYTGLMHLGFEIIGAKSVPVYAMPRMKSFLESSGPWHQLVRLQNIDIQPVNDGVEVQLNERIRITPFLVPHRDEYSETVGYRISGPNQSAIFIPDIDKWEKWDRQIEELITSSDRAYLDGSFYYNDEVQGRDMSEFPHPFIIESMQRFAELQQTDRQKVTFIHFNHSNPVMQPQSEQAQAVLKKGFRLAKEGEIFKL